MVSPFFIEEIFQHILFNTPFRLHVVNQVKPVGNISAVKSREVI